ncbi:hypothetical protein ACP70R_050351 [Stipagrostis hirtigluma subsp. patula]
MANLAVVVLFALLGAAAAQSYSGYQTPAKAAPAASPEGSPPQTYPGYGTPSISTPPAASPAGSPYTYPVPPVPSPPPPAPAPPSPSPRLKVGFYRRSCPRVEQIVKEAVKNATRSNPGIGAGLIRMAFHDCFVQGCDASVLLDNSTANPNPEKSAPPNFPSLRGFEVIDAAKAALEAACPGKVSCADIVQFAARDAAVVLSGGRVNYRLPAGRLDGRVSIDTETIALPPPTFNLTELIGNFAAKGLNIDDLVVLSGAHTVGLSHCSSFVPDGRLNSSTSDMDPALAAALRRRCPANPNITNDPTVVQDIVTPNRFDNRYYKNVLRRQVLFTSDAALMRSRQTSRKVVANAFIPGAWERKFARAMVKMSLIELKTAANGEIRTKSCRVVN